jgi:hypothetical protein
MEEIGDEEEAGVVYFQMAFDYEYQIIIRFIVVATDTAFGSRAV